MQQLAETCFHKAKTESSFSSEHEEMLKEQVFYKTAKSEEHDSQHEEVKSDNKIALDEPRCSLKAVEMNQVANLRSCLKSSARLRRMTRKRSKDMQTGRGQSLPRYALRNCQRHRDAEGELTCQT